MPLLAWLNQGFETYFLVRGIRYINHTILATEGQVRMKSVKQLLEMHIHLVLPLFKFVKPIPTERDTVANTSKKHLSAMENNFDSKMYPK